MTCGYYFTLCALHHTDLYLLILSAVIFGISLTGFRWPWSATEMIVYGTVFVRAKLAPALLLQQLRLLRSRNTYTSGREGGITIFPWHGHGRFQYGIHSVSYTHLTLPTKA